MNETWAISVCGKMGKLHYIHDLLVLNLLNKNNKKSELRLRELSTHEQSRRTPLNSLKPLYQHRLSQSFLLESHVFENTASS